MLADHLLRFTYKKLHPNAKAPSKKSGDIGWDLKCVSNENFLNVYCGDLEEYIDCVEIPSGRRAVINTGIAIELPVGYHAILKPRSGLAVKNGIDVLAGVVDNSYRGEIMVCLQNNGYKTFRICEGDRIAQMIIVKENEGFFDLVEELSDTNRGEQGFGSSGR